MKNSYFQSRILLTAMLFFITIGSKAQSIQRQSISSTGTYNQTDGVLIQQTIGQPYATGGYYANDLVLRPGFQQFSNIKLELIRPPAEFSLNVYPNPVIQSVTIESREVIDQAFIQVTDLNGRITIKENVADLRTHVINCNEWPNGIYFITLYNKNKNIFSSKIIKSKN